MATDGYIPYAELDKEQRRLVDSPNKNAVIYAAREGLGLDRLVSSGSPMVRQIIAGKGFGLDRLSCDQDWQVVEAVTRKLHDLGTSLERWIAENPDRCALPENRGELAISGPLTESRSRNELLRDLIETVEDFLEERGISVPNSEKDDAMAAGESPYDICTIYGSDYGELSDGFESVLVGWDLLPQESWRHDAGIRL